MELLLLLINKITILGQLILELLQVMLQQEQVKVIKFGKLMLTEIQDGEMMQTQLMVEQQRLLQV